MLLKAWQTLVSSWELVFSQARTHQRALALALGFLGGVGRRTLTRALGFLGKEHQDWSADYKLFSRSKWDPAELFDPMLREGVERYCPPGQPIAAAVDDTLLRRRGKQVPNTAWQRDPLGPPFRVNLVWGQRFMQTSLLLPLYRRDAKSPPRAPCRCGLPSARWRASRANGPPQGSGPNTGGPKRSTTCPPAL